MEISVLDNDVPPRQYCRLFWSHHDEIRTTLGLSEGRPDTIADPKANDIGALLPHRWRLCQVRAFGPSHGSM